MITEPRKWLLITEGVSLVAVTATSVITRALVGKGFATEVNPLMAWLVETYNWYVFGLAKVLVVLAFFTGLWVVASHRSANVAVACGIVFAWLLSLNVTHDAVVATQYPPRALLGGFPLTLSAATLVLVVLVCGPRRIVVPNALHTNEFPVDAHRKRARRYRGDDLQE